MRAPSVSTLPTMLEHSAKDVTTLLRAWGAGDSQASDAVAPLVYDELRRQAQLALRREGDGHIEDNEAASGSIKTTSRSHPLARRAESDRATAGIRRPDEDH